MSKKPVGFQIGDSVVVKAGVRDPDDGSVELGGWQGRVVETSYDHDGSPLVDIEWDGPTLLQMPLELVTVTLLQGLDFGYMCLGVDEVSRETPWKRPKRRRWRLKKTSSAR